MAITTPAYKSPMTQLIDWRDSQRKLRYLTHGGPIPYPVPTIVVNRWPETYRDRRHVMIRWLCESGYVGLANELACTDESGLSKWWKRRLGPFSLAVNEYATDVLHRLSRIDEREVLAAVRQRQNVDGYGVRVADGDYVITSHRTERGVDYWQTDVRHDTLRVPVEYPDVRHRQTRTIIVDIRVGYAGHEETVYIQRVRRENMKVFDTVDGLRFEVPIDDIEPEFYQALPAALRVTT